MQRLSFWVPTICVPLCFGIMISYIFINMESPIGPIAGIIGLFYILILHLSDWLTVQSFLKVGNLYYIGDSFAAGRFCSRDGYEYHVCSVWDLKAKNIPPRTSRGIKNLLLTHHSVSLVIPYDLSLDEGSGDKFEAIRYPVLVFEWPLEYNTPKERKEKTAILDYESGRQLAMLIEKEES